MASVEERLQILEQYVVNSKALNQMPIISTLSGNETVAVYSQSITSLAQYPLADILAGGTIDPTNDMIATFVNVPNPDFSLDIESQIATYINTGTLFTKTANQFVFYVVTRKRVNLTNASGWDFYRELYLLNRVKGDYGTASGNTVLSTDIVFYSRFLANDSNTQTIVVSSTLPYSIETVVNGSTAVTPTPSGNILIQVDIAGNPSEYWLYQGQTTQDLGSGGYVSSASDYIELATATQDPMFDGGNSSVNIENVIIVNQSNVATTLGGTIDSTKQYFIDGSIDMSGVSVTVPSTGIFISGTNLDLSELTCADNSYTMFSGGTAGNVFMQDLSLEVTGTSSQVFDLTDATGFNATEFVRVNFNNCTAIGELNGYRQGLENNTGRFGGTPEMTLSGTWLGGYFIDTSIVRGLTDGGYSLYKAGTAFSMNSRFRTNQNIDLPASASFFNFSPSNFVNPSTVQVTGALVSRNGTFDSTDSNITPNITQADLESAWSNNIGMPNTFEGGRLTVSSENLTNIAAGSTWYTLNAVWSASGLEHFDSPASGQLRHLGNSPREYRCVVNFVIESTANNDIGIRLRKWDESASAFVDFTERRRDVNSFVGGRDVAFFNFIFNVSLDQNDYVFFQVRNNSGNNNLTLELDSDFVIEER